MARAAELEQAQEAERRRPKGGPGPPQHPSDDRHAPTALQPAATQGSFCLHLLVIAQLGLCLQGAIDLIDPRQAVLDGRQHLFFQPGDLLFSIGPINPGAAQRPAGMAPQD